jgi:hypothetical protein
MRFIWEKLRTAVRAIRRNLPSVMAGSVVMVFIWLVLSMVLSEQLNRLTNTVRNLWLSPLIVFLFVLGWFGWAEVAPNYSRKGEVWWLDLFWIPWLGKLPPYKGRPEMQWRHQWKVISGGVIFMGIIILVVSLLSIFGIMGNLKLSGPVFHVP